MTWSYDNTDLDTDTDSGRLNVVRFLIGDTDSSDEQLQDEEVIFLLSQANDNYYSAASKAAKSISAKYSRLVTTELDGQLTMEYGELASSYATLSGSLEEDAKDLSNSYTIVAGGLGFKPRMRRDQWRNPPFLESPHPYED